MRRAVARDNRRTGSSYSTRDKSFEDKIREIALYERCNLQPDYNVIIQMRERFVVIYTEIIHTFAFNMHNISQYFFYYTLSGGKCTFFFFLQITHN